MIGLVKMNKQIINNTNHEITTSEGWVIPSKIYDPQLSSYHKCTERYTLKKEGFQDLKLRKMFGQWEMLAYKNHHTGDERWYKLSNFSEEIIQKHIKLYSKE